jgi:hypothetical protein
VSNLHLEEIQAAANEWNCNIINPLNAELNPIRHLLALVGAHHFVHVSRIRVKDRFREVIRKLPRSYGEGITFSVQITLR